jgi:hypothetical protein
MSNAILPLVLLGSIGGSVAAVAYGVKTDWEFLGGKDKEPEYTPPAQQSLMGGGGGDVGSLIVDDFVVGGDEEDMTMIDEDGETFTDTVPHLADYDDDDTNISAFTGMPINCPDDEEEGQSAMRGFKFYHTTEKVTLLATAEAALITANNLMVTADTTALVTTASDAIRAAKKLVREASPVYGYQCSTLENPGSLQFGKVGNYKSHRGDISDLHGSQALCASNQALVGFVLDQNKSGTKSGYRYDCIDIKGPAKVRTAITSYKPYDSGENISADIAEVTGSADAVPVVAVDKGDDAFANQLKTLREIGDISCREGELLQGFATEKSGNNMRYIYRCITPGYEAD